MNDRGRAIVCHALGPYRYPVLRRRIPC